jgi:cobalt-zinc-cadmium resistance protein CzcA
VRAYVHHGPPPNGSSFSRSRSAAIGFISLFGVSVMSGILIITSYYRVAAANMPPAEAMFLAVEQQMRPILMMGQTALSPLLWCLPPSPRS